MVVVDALKEGLDFASLIAFGFAHPASQRTRGALDAGNCTSIPGACVSRASVWGMTTCQVNSDYQDNGRNCGTPCLCRTTS